MLNTTIKGSHHTSIEVPKIKRLSSNTNEDVKLWNICTLLADVQTGTDTLEKHLAKSLTVNKCMTYTSNRNTDLSLSKDTERNTVIIFLTGKTRVLQNIMKCYRLIKLILLQ